MKYLIVGRTATGKDTLANKLAEKGLKQVISRTTRPKRDEKDNSHIFVTKEQSNNEEEKKIAKTVIDGNEYYILPEDLEGKDVYIVDVIGAKELTNKMPDENFTIVWMNATKANQKDYFIKRAMDAGASKEDAVNTFEARSNAEDEQFKEFETTLVQGEGSLNTDYFPDCVISVLPFRCEYTGHALDEQVKTLYTNHCALQKILPLIPSAIKAGIVDKGDEPGTVKTYLRNGQSGSMSYERMASHMLTDPYASSSFFISLLLNTDLFSSTRQEEEPPKKSFWKRIFGSSK